VIPTVKDLIKLLDRLISDAQHLLETLPPEEEPTKKRRLGVMRRPDRPEFVAFRTRAIYFIDMSLGRDNEYFTQFRNYCQMDCANHLAWGRSLLESVRVELTTRRQWTTGGMASASVFADFLDMAEELLAKEYKDAAAVIIGSVLEQHIRRLCLLNETKTADVKDGRSVPRSTQRLNQELASHDVYSKVDQQMVTGWLALRNEAAHGNYGYSIEQVSNMLRGTTEFIARNPV
jgi:hypothetical protein